MRSLARSRPRLTLYPDYARLVFGAGGDLNNGGFYFVQEIDPAPPRTKSHKSGRPNRAEVALRAGEALKWSSHIMDPASPITASDRARQELGKQPCGSCPKVRGGTFCTCDPGTSGDCALVGNQVQNFRGWFSCFVLSLSSPPQTNRYFGRLPPQ
ncbi:hypothetical protein B0H14DRAFT_2751263 [Mycena olivaceomarginata]|nr:hypothetical protein B0H14DRAFT_2751263 [Mycena olivaceomarginata]